MRVLTVRQPWAWAIIHGGKDVENRVRNIAGDYRGPVAIHAGQAWDDSVTWNSSWETLLAAMQADGADPFDAPWQVERGVIIGVVDLVDVHRNPDAQGCLPTGDRDGRLKPCSRWAEPGVHHLVLANPRALDEPIPWKGGLGLRRSKLDVYGDVLLEAVDGCTCGAGRISYQHEPMCGFEMVARLVATS